MKIEMLDGGWFTAPAGVLRDGEPMDERMRFPVPVFLIETADERILIDTGLNPAALGDPGAYYERPDIFSMFALGQQRSVAEQVDLSTLTKVVLTHLHWDHVGGLEQIPRRLRSSSSAPSGRPGTTTARSRGTRSWHATTRRGDRELVLLDGDHDLLGDGSIELLSTPGHTGGHQSVRVGDIVLGGDVTHFASGLDDHRFPIFGHDLAQQARSAERLRALREQGLTVMPGHDPDVLRVGPVCR